MNSTDTRLLRQHTEIANYLADVAAAILRQSGIDPTAIKKPLHERFDFELRRIAESDTYIAEQRSKVKIARGLFN